MARAIARGWGEPVLCSDSGSGRALALAEELGGRAASNREVAEEADLVVLCHKPYQFQQIAREISGSVKAVASVLGATSTVTPRRAGELPYDFTTPLPDSRVMPAPPLRAGTVLLSY